MADIGSGLGHATGIMADVSTSSTGGTDTGDYVKAYTLTHGEYTVKKIQVWTATGSGRWKDRQLVKDIELTWTDGHVNHITGNQSGNSTDLTFEDAEKVKSLTLRTGDRVDKVELITDQDHELKEGEDHGSEKVQRIGGGGLLGFTGNWDTVNKELISIGSKFNSKK